MKKGVRRVFNEDYEIRFARKRMDEYAERMKSYPSVPDNPIVEELKTELRDEAAIIEKKQRYGEEYPEPKEVVIGRAEIVARKAMEIAVRSHDEELALGSAIVYAKINPENLVGSGETANFVKGHLDSIYNSIGRKDKDRAERFRESVEKLRRASDLEEEVREFRTKGYVAKRLAPRALPPKAAVAAACIAGFFAGVALFAGGITGNTISGLSQTSSNLVGVVILVLGLIGMIWASKSENK